DLGRARDLDDVQADGRTDVGIAVAAGAERGADRLRGGVGLVCRADLHVAAGGRERDAVRDPRHVRRRDPADGDRGGDADAPAVLAGFARCLAVRGVGVVLRRGELAAAAIGRALVVGVRVVAVDLAIGLRVGVVVARVAALRAGLGLDRAVHRTRGRD